MIEVGLQRIETTTPAEERDLTTGWLHLEGVDLCRVAVDPSDPLPRVVSWCENRGPGDLAALETAVSASHPTRDSPDGPRPTTILDLCLDAFATHAATVALTRELETAVLFHEASDEAASAPVLKVVPVPPGGSIEGAISFVRSSHPGSTILNGMDPTEALRIYIDVAGE